MVIIPQHKVDFHPHSFADQRLRLFNWNGHIYRGISSELAPLFRQLFQDSVIQSLTNQGLLIDSEVTSLLIDSYEIVVQHRAISFTSYPNEWCAAMLKDAALTIIDLAIKLAENNLTLKDAHPWNIMFDIDRCKLIFVDFGSISALDNNLWSAYDEFCRFCFYPLMLMSYGENQIARLLMCEDSGVLQSNALKLTGNLTLAVQSRKQSLVRGLKWLLQQTLPSSSVQRLKQIWRALPFVSLSELHGSQTDFTSGENINQKSHLHFLNNVRQQVESVRLPISKNPALNHDDNPVNWTVKQRNVHQIITKIRPASVLDIGCHTGWYSMLAARLGSKVIAFDIDESCITQIYAEVCENSLPILPLIMDFTKPTPSRGLANHWAIAATKRLQCDMVLALGLVHHIVFEERLNFDQIVEGLALFSKQWVVVEFVPPENEEVSAKYSTQFAWYSRENFIRALRKHFRHVTMMPSYPEYRVLLLCEK